MRIFWALSLLPVLAACSAGPACLRDQPYKSAEEFPPLEAPAGMSVPQPDPNLEVPEVEDGPVAAYPPEAGDESEGRRCLAMPPSVPEEQQAKSE